MHATHLSADNLPQSEDCNCLAVRQAARRVTQFYDPFLAPSGLRTTQFSMLAKLRRFGPMTINALAAAMVMDRTTLGRALRPLQRGGLVALSRRPLDRRSKEIHLTALGAERISGAVEGWRRAQDRFDEVFGVERAAHLRALLHAVSASALA